MKYATVLLCSAMLASASPLLVEEVNHDAPKLPDKAKQPSGSDHIDPTDDSSPWDQFQHLYGDGDPVPVVQKGQLEEYENSQEHDQAKPTVDEPKQEHAADTAADEPDKKVAAADANSKFKASGGGGQTFSQEKVTDRFANWCSTSTGSDRGVSQESCVVAYESCWSIGWASKRLTKDELDNVKKCKDKVDEYNARPTKYSHFCFDLLLVPETQAWETCKNKYQENKSKGVHAQDHTLKDLKKAGVAFDLDMTLEQDKSRHQKPSKPTTN